MFDHPIIDAALGLALAYTLLRLVASAVQELLAALTTHFRLRALRSKESDLDSGAP